MKTQYILDFLILGLLLVPAVIGYRKGLLKTLIGMSALIVSLLVTCLFSAKVTSWLKTNTDMVSHINDRIYSELDERIERRINNHPGSSNAEINSDILPGGLINYIEKSEENLFNYDTKTFTAKVSYRLAEVVVSICGVIFTFGGCYLLLRLIMFLSGAANELPGVKIVNQGMGAVMGLLRGLIMVWVLCLLLTIFSQTAAGMKIMSAINDSVLLKAIYNAALNFSRMLRIGV